MSKTQDSIFSCVYKHVIKLVGCDENLMCTGGNLNRPVIYIITVDESMWRPICLGDFHDRCTHGHGRTVMVCTTCLVIRLKIFIAYPSQRLYFPSIKIIG